MSRLVVVSNRVGPIRDSARAGGLAVAIVDALKRRGGLWFGWSGQVTEEGTHGRLKTEEAGRISLATIDIDQSDYETFYAGYANRTLWPVFHYRLDLARFDRDLLRGYWSVNERFAARLFPLLGPDDTVWVHDYHFMPLAAKLRAMGANHPIGFFLHIPFPVPEVLASLPRWHDLMRAMLAYDLIGFQTERDRQAFVRYFLEEEGGSFDGEWLEVNGRRVRVGVFPVGIDPQAFRRFAASPEAERQEQRMRQVLGDRLQLIGVDRLDYSKGIVQRFEAFGRLLEQYPENLNRVTLLQVAPPSRSDVEAYADIREGLERFAGHLNGLYADIDWTPIRLIVRAFQRRALAGIFRASRVGLVTPLRDGMNLVAKEYVAAQDDADPGVLVLSRFAGAAEALDGALLVNPYDTDGTAEMLQRAVTMPLEERRDRWRRMFEVIERDSAENWWTSYMTALRASR